MRELGKISVSSLREQVYSRLKDLILTNQIAPGQRIVIDQLGREFGVSHTPLREALAMLELDGLVTMEHHKQPHVTDIDEGDVKDIYELRSLLEGFASARAALTISNERLHYLDNLLEDAEKKVNDGDLSSLVEADVELHWSILEELDNALLKRVFELVDNQSIRVRSLVESTGDLANARIGLDEHRRILTALRARKTEEARKQMEEHLSSAMERTLAVLRAQRETEDTLP